MRTTLALLTLAAIGTASCGTSPGTSTVQAERSDTIAAEPATTDASGGADPGPGTLDWAACDASDFVFDFECAAVEVPIDHEQADGDTIELALIRVRATDPDDRIGSLVFNPGGPGGSGVEFLRSFAAAVPAEVAARFDLVGFDPRGVGDSTAVDCDVQIDDNVDLLEAGDDAGWAELVDEALTLTDQQCPPESLDLAPYVGTNNAARDLDVIREALGDDQLSYVGYSYGTRLGATYAELFPDRVRALVLDAAVRPSTDFAELDAEQAEGFDRALENFAAACDADIDCVLQELGPTLDVLAGLEAEILALGSFPTDDPERVLTPGELSLGVAAALYSKSAWPFLADALYVAETQADGTLLQVLGDSLVGRQPDGSYDNSQEANFFINCADDVSRPPVDEVRMQSDSAASRSTYFDDFLRATTGCIGAPDPLDPLIVGPAAGAAPILVVGNTGDPATPYEWSVAMAESLESGVLYTVEAEGHTAYATIPCVETVVNSYLIDLVLPAEDASCSDNETADFFLPAGEGELDQVLALFDCLRDNGADIPELTVGDLLADPTGETILELFDLEDPAFLDAALQCSALLADF